MLIYFHLSWLNLEIAQDALTFDLSIWQKSKVYQPGNLSDIVLYHMTSRLGVK